MKSTKKNNDEEKLKKKIDCSSSLQIQIIYKLFYL